MIKGPAGHDGAVHGAARAGPACAGFGLPAVAPAAAPQVLSVGAHVGSIWRCSVQGGREATNDARAAAAPAPRVRAARLLR